MAEVKIDFVKEIERLKKEKNAVIMAHYYQTGDIQDIADRIGDSLALAQMATKTDADIIVLCGVHFMGETAKILCPDKKVLVPDATAGCSLADSCPAADFAEFIKQHPGHKVISYVNTTAEVKALTDVVVTSSNAKQIVESFHADQPLIFGPDHNLGSYINSVTGRNMVLWNGACHVHQKFSVEGIIKLKHENPGAKVLVHPECPGAVVNLADKVGSTAALLKFALNDSADKFIVATESGILHEMQKGAPNKTFIPAPPEISEGKVGCGCNDCNYMKQNTLEKVYLALKNEQPEIIIDKELREKAVKPIERMLEISAKLGL